MKGKQSRLKLNTLHRQISDFSIEQSLQSQMEPSKSKLNQNKIDSTISSFSQNQISTASLSVKNIKTNGNQEEIDNDNSFHQKSRKSNKKKIIEKKIILTSRDRHGKSSRILKNQKALKHKLKLRKAQKLKSGTKIIKIKSNILPTTSKPVQLKPKTPIISKTDQKLQKINFDECADIRMIGFDRKQLKKKRDDLLKRTVEDWSFIQKLRSDRRQLRELSIC